MLAASIPLQALEHAHRDSVVPAGLRVLRGPQRGAQDVLAAREELAKAKRLGAGQCAATFLPRVLVIPQSEQSLGACDRREDGQVNQTAAVRPGG